MNKETVTMSTKVYEMMMDIIREHTALLDELYKNNIIPRYSKITQFDETRVYCDLMKFELKGEYPPC